MQERLRHRENSIHGSRSHPKTEPNANKRAKKLEISYVIALLLVRAAPHANEYQSILLVLTNDFGIEDDYSD